MRLEDKNIKIRMQFLNEPVIVLILLFEFFVFVYLGITTDLPLYDYKSSILLLFCVFGLSALFSWLVFRIRVTFDFELGKPRITAKGLLSKTVVVWPFQFCMGKQLITTYRRSRINDYLMIYTENKSIRLSVKSTDLETNDDYYFEKGSTFMDTYTAIGESKHLIWETFWILESYEKNPNAEIRLSKKIIDKSYDLIERLKQTKEKDFNPFEEK